MGSVAIMITPQQQKNRKAIARAKQRIINYLNKNEMIIIYLLGLTIVFGFGFLAVAVA